MITGLIRLIACIAGMACALGLQAQTYPSRPIRLIVPFPPGGSSDSVARVVVQKFSEGLGQPVVIENRPGVGGLLGSEAVAKAAPDGYTLLLGSVSSLGVAPHIFSNPRIDPQKDFAAIAPILSSPPAGRIERQRRARRRPEILRRTWAAGRHREPAGGRRPAGLGSGGEGRAQRVHASSRQHRLQVRRGQHHSSAGESREGEGAGSDEREAHRPLA